MSVNTVPVFIPKEVVSDDFYIVVAINMENGTKVEEGEIIGAVETSKAIVEIEAPIFGYIHYKYKQDDEIPAEAVFAVISDSQIVPKEIIQGSENVGTPEIDKIERDNDIRISKAAKKMIQEKNIDISIFSNKKFVSKSDVEKIVENEQDKSKRMPLKYGSEELNSDFDWDHILSSTKYEELISLLAALRKRMKAKFNRHVPLGTLLNDRWELAENYNFGSNANVYDECLIIGNVSVGENCWIGPYTILDGGNASLIIGDYTSIGSGSHIYTHNTIERALTGGKALSYKKETKIGKCCFISPLTMIGPGTVIGDHCFISAGSYVQGIFPSYSFISGNPAKQVGRITIDGNKALLKRFHE